MAEDTGGMTFPLHKKIEAHGETIAELKLREPTALDIIEVGNPVRLDGANNTIFHDDRKMQHMIARLANVPPSAVAQLAPNDFVAIGWALTPFFGAGLAGT
ncbi:phage tail assembly protein [Bosea sp. BK604]|uniref:phage tail assembly protein n=1 Tax=Bosea sp. BK604 TaxID=2512180 RepID=UPI001051CB44|nr:phage tail assembly protein [Bosea sp. BK604]TCR60941.1 tail assembly chaperone E/41/14-like protein [Bosea sp. BK604]